MKISSEAHGAGLIFTCDICGQQIMTKQYVTPDGAVFVLADEILQDWIDHQLTDECKSGSNSSG